MRINGARIEELCRQHIVTVEFYTHHEFTDHMKYEIEKRTGRCEKCWLINTG